MTCQGCKVYGNVPHRCKNGDCDCVGCNRLGKASMVAATNIKDHVRYMSASDVAIVIDAVLDNEREECAKIAENWGGAPPNPHGRRAALAKKIRERKGT